MFGAANYAQMPRYAIRETVDKQEDGNSVAACGAHDTLPRRQSFHLTFTTRGTFSR